MLFLPCYAIHKITDSEYLDVIKSPYREQIVVSTYDVKALPVNCTRDELVVVGITADMDIGTDLDNFKSGEKLLKRDLSAECGILLLQPKNDLFVFIHNLLACHDLYPALHNVMQELVRLAPEEDGRGNDIGIYYDPHLRFSALIALISALISSSVSPSCSAVFCACSINE